MISSPPETAPETLPDTVEPKPVRVPDARTPVEDEPVVHPVRFA